MVGVAGFVLGVFAGLATVIAVWDLENADTMAFLTLGIGFGTTISSIGVILVSGRARVVWRMVTSRAALIAGLAIVVLTTWDLDSTWLLTTGAAVVGIEIWSSHLAAEYRGFPSPVTAGERSFDSRDIG
jgi:hypothetical protein